MRMMQTTHTYSEEKGKKAFCGLNMHTNSMQPVNYIAYIHAFHKNLLLATTQNLYSSFHGKLIQSVACNNHKVNTEVNLCQLIFIIPFIWMIQYCCCWWSLFEFSFWDDFDQKSKVKVKTDRFQSTNDSKNGQNIARKQLIEFENKTRIKWKFSWSFQFFP